MRHPAYFLTLALLLCSCTSQQEQQELEHILAVGDSITEQTSTGMTYSELLSLMTGRQVTNAGCGIMTSAGALLTVEDERLGFQCAKSAVTFEDGTFAWDYFQTLVEPARPFGLATVLLGANDTRFTSSCLLRPCDRTPLESHEFIANLREIIARLDVPVVLLTTYHFLDPPLNLGVDPRLAALRMDQYAEGIAALCAEQEDVHCGPDLRNVILPGHYADFVHLNAAGHLAVAKALAEWLREEGL